MEQSPNNFPDNNNNNNIGGIRNIGANHAVGSVLANPPASIAQGMPCFPIPPPSLFALLPKMGRPLRHFGNTINGKPVVPNNSNKLLWLRNLIDSGEIIDLAKSKKGYAVAENNLPLHGDPSRTKLCDIFLLQDVFYNVCGDRNANLFMQMLVEQSSHAERARIVSLVQGYLTVLSCNRHSTRALWSLLDENLRMIILGKLDGHEIDTAIDGNGTHFIQTIISVSPLSTLAPIVEAFIATNVCLVTLVEDRNGCRVLQIVIEKLEKEMASTPSQKMKIFAEKLLMTVIGNLEHFVNHQSANYAIQCIFSLSVLSRFANMAIGKLLGRLLTLSQEKYASHVVEKAVECGSTTALCSLMDEIFDGYQCDRIIKLREGGKKTALLRLRLTSKRNFAATKKMFEVAIDVRNGKRSGKLEWFDRLAERIGERHDQLCRYSSGKKLIERLFEVLMHDKVNDVNQNAVMPY